MLPDSIYTYDLLRPKDPSPPRPITNEPVSVHVLDGEETVLFGTGFASDAERLIEELEAFDGPDVIVVEHADPDHFDALPDLLEAFDATVAIPADDAEEMTEFIGIEPDVELEDGEERWGIRTIHVPGHTPGNMSFLHEETDTLFVGDTFVHANSFAAAPGEWNGALAPIKPGLNADNDAALENISILEDYDFDVALMTHGVNVYEDAHKELETLVDDIEANR